MNESGNPLCGGKPFNWYQPDYQPIWAERIKRLARLRADPGLLAAVKVYYKHNLADFINDHGITVNPKNVGTAIPVQMPFLLFPKQREFVEWVVARWQNKENGILVKSREMGASWMAIATATAMCCFWDDVAIGFGSATEDKVDGRGDPDTLFYKARAFITYLPPEFIPGWDIKKHSAMKSLLFPWTGSSIIGQQGDNIGRGGRKTIWFIDEFAFFERPGVVDSNLVAATDTRIEMSSVHGLANTFAQRARDGNVPRFDFHYRDDPRRTEIIDGVPTTRPDFAKFLAGLVPMVREQEYEANFNAGIQGQIIHPAWASAAIGAAQKLKIIPTGEKRGAYDVADEGKDKNCFAAMRGIEVYFVKSWSGGGSHIWESVEQVFGLSDERKLDSWVYDGDGMGANVRSDVNKIIERRTEQGRGTPRIHMFRGSAAVADPEDICPGTDRLNKDFFHNYKAQSWWACMGRFLNTFRAVNGQEYDPDNLISLDPNMPELDKTLAELTQPVWKLSQTGKTLVDKTPDGVPSPNNADCIMMLCAYSRGPLDVSEETLTMFGGGADGATLDDIAQLLNQPE